MLTLEGSAFGLAERSTAFSFSRLSAARASDTMRGVQAKHRGTVMLGNRGAVLAVALLVFVTPLWNSAAPTSGVLKGVNLASDEPHDEGDGTGPRSRPQERDRAEVG
jgi:hypothetical protein